MNPEQLLSVVAHLIKNRPVSPGGRWYICFKDNKIQVVPLGATPIPEYVFLILTESMIQKGLSNAEWGLLRNRLYNFFKEKKS